VYEMNKLLTAASLAVTSFVVLASPAFAQGMAAPAANDGMASGSMAGPSHMANDTMKMDHKKPMKKTAMKHDAMGAGMAAPSGGMSSGTTPSGSMSGPNH
jgi:pentapeptide MXKDX repeat protein